MTIFSSKAAGGFYDDSIHSVHQIPGDAVEITRERHIELLEGQSMGLLISSDEDGYPILIDPPAQPPEIIAAGERAWRDAELTSTEWLVTRHRDEKELNLVLTLTAEQFSELLVYRQALRDWPQKSTFPDTTLRPVTPSWIADQGK